MVLAAVVVAVAVAVVVVVVVVVVKRGVEVQQYYSGNTHKQR